MSRPYTWLRGHVARIARGAPRSTDRLSDFRLSGRLWPLTALLSIGTVFYLIWGYGSQLVLLLQLCAAYAVAHICLAALSHLRGPNPPWRLIVPTAVLGAVAGGCVFGVIALGPEWAELLSWKNIAREGRFGAAFSAFFVGLSLVTAAVRQSERTEAENREQLLEARLKMLTARIEPHFMMNTLANLHSLVEADSAAAKEMLGHLSSLLQGALERSRDLNTTLGQELQLIESYLSIMQMRFGDKLRFDIDVPATLRSMRFPALVLQTLVENAVKHGIEPSPRPGRVTISAAADRDRITLCLVDDGVGFDSSARPVGGEGWRNVTERLETFYRGRATFQVDSIAGSGTEVTLVIPRKES